MSQFFKRFAAATAIVGTGVLLLGGGFYAVGARINTTKSIPVGLYWTSSKPVEKGAYVLFCPPQVGVFVDAKERGYIGAGFCPGGYGFMMKRVLAAKNDSVFISADGVRVNGNLLSSSAPIKADKAGRPLPRYQTDHFTLGNSEVLLMSDVSGTSFDGRYFGPINRSQIKTVISPVITW
jgi:conjugative transfer signal peptidase TraF